MKVESIFERLPKKKITRKGFLKLCGIGAGSLMLNNALFKFAFGKEEISTGRTVKKIKGLHDLVVAKGDDPYLMTMKAMEAIGGMDKFVKKNSVVLIKPNIGWDRTPEQAANTNPQVVGALVDMCFNSGAKRVNVFDNPCNDPKRCYKNSGIEKIAKEKGANVYSPDDWNVVKARFDYQSPMEGWPVFRDALECDTFINVPVLKHHRLAGLTLSMKNLMGVCSGNRGLIHFDMGIKLAHLTDFIKPDLAVIDAYRVLKKNGPTGGNLEDVVDMKTLIVGTDPVLCDSYACVLMGVEPLSVSYVDYAVKHDLGKGDYAEIAKADILTIKV
ncbi:MAG: DUF362 domain-containing protein [Candidatus Omnitrophota bacterium]|nr:DUF362 domain-containing protein [Candidatus Omnitrophota bacterium]